MTALRWATGRFSIHTTVVMAFLIVTLLISSVTLGLYYYFSQLLARDSALAIYEQTASSTHDFVEQLENKAEETAFTLSKFPKLVEDKGITHQTRAVFAETLNRNPLLSFMTIGFADGGFYQLINLDANVKMREQFNAVANDKWVVVTIREEHDNRYLHFDYLNHAFERRYSLQYLTNYDVRTRSWYTQAQTGQVYKSEPYLFQHLQVPGQAYSIVLDGSQHVLAIGIALPSLSVFLSQQTLPKQSQIYLHQKNGEIIASNIRQQERLLPPAPSMTLTPEQQKLVAEHPYLTVSNELNWPPINFASAGQPRGYAIDVLTYIAEMTGFQLRYVNGLNWDEMATLFVNKELDIVQPVFYNLTREAVGDLSHAFLRAPYGVVTRTGYELIENAERLQGKKVAIQRGWSLSERLAYHYPDIDIYLVDSVEEMFHAVQEGIVDAGIDTSVVLDYYLTLFFVEGVMVHPNLSFEPHTFSTDLHFMVNDALPGVTALINQSLAALGEGHKQALFNKWFSEAKTVSKPKILPYSGLIELIGSPELMGLNTATIDDENYFVYSSPVNMTEQEGDYLTILTPESSVTSPYMERVVTSIWITAVLISLLLPVIWLFIRPIARSIRALAQDSERIKQRRYDEVRYVDSNISEIHELSQSMMTMSSSIQSHEASQQALIESFIELIAQAIDDKSPYTADHCARVPELAFMLADAAQESMSGPFADFGFKTEDEWREFRIGAWLHDCGKITTPEHIIDKGTKLETIYNRIHEVRMRFEVLWRDAEIRYWMAVAQGDDNTAQLQSDLDACHAQLQADFLFIASCNVGSESLSQTDIDRLNTLATVTWQRHFSDRMGLSPVEEARLVGAESTLPATESLLSDKPQHIVARDKSTDYDPKLGINMVVPEHLYHLGEMYNLTVRAGTLTKEDRFKINEHMISTVKMLESLPFPPELSKVPRYATTHHETLTGTGYPRGLSAPDLSMPERIMVVADVFEALTAADRPYKEAKPISEAISILYKLVCKGNIDADVFELFLTSGVYRQYAERFLSAEQLDDIDINAFLRPKS